MGRCMDMYMFMVVLIIVLMLYAYRMPCEEQKTKKELLVRTLQYETCMSKFTPLLTFITWSVYWEISLFLRMVNLS